MPMDESELRNIALNIINGAMSDEPVQLTLVEFRHLYELVVSEAHRRTPKLVIINLEDQAFIIFADYSPQEFIVSSTSGITKEDFSYSAITDWFGSRSPKISFLGFIFREIRSKPFLILLLFLSSVILLIITGPRSSFLDTLYSLLIQSSTVFLSIYLIFTVSQSDRLRSDEKLFKSGTFHRYYSDDRNVTIFGIMTIGMVFFSFLLTKIPGVENSLVSAPITSIPRWIVSISTGITLTMLFYTFIIVSTYYLERTRDVVERDHISRILHDEYSKGKK